MAHNRNNDFSFNAPTLGDNFFLKIRTGKNTRTGRLETIASVHEKRGAFETHRAFYDYFEAIIYSDKRGTQKAIDDQHAEALGMLDHITQRARDHYIVHYVANDSHTNENRARN